MSISRGATLGLLASTVPALMLGSPSLAEGTTVNVSLWDKGPDSLMEFGSVKPMGMVMMDADMSMATLGVTASMTEIPAGEVTFEVVNDSLIMAHEMVLAAVADVNAALPYDIDEEKVDEDAAGHIGEVAELEPGQSGALTVKLEPVDSIPYCNVYGHYAMGMWTLIKVV